MPGPVNMIDPEGRAVAVPEESVADAAARGFRVEGGGAAAERAAEDQRQETYGGAVGKIASFGSGVLSGATLGASDFALGGLDDLGELKTIKDVNPGSRMVGELAGGVAASFAAPGSALARSPAGILAQAANRGVEAARAVGGIGGALGQVAITGAEAAIQNAGSYLGEVALGDRKLTAEGLGGALGSGFVFGAGGGAAALGIEKGTIAARRMFSSVMEGGDDAALRAAGEWERKSKELFDGNRQTLDEAKRQLDDAITASQEAKLAELRAGQRVAEERIYAGRARPADAPPGASVVDDLAAPPAVSAVDPVEAMQARIAAGEVPGEVGPFTPDGLRAAAERAISKERTRAKLGGFEFPGDAVDDAAREVKRGVKDARKTARPAPIEAEIADEAATVAAGRPPLRDPAEVFGEHGVRPKIEDTGRRFELTLQSDDGRRIGRLLAEKDGSGDFRISHTRIYDENMRGKGLGAAMYRDLADHLETKYGKPLLSDYARSDDAERVWRKLERDGQARPVFDPSVPERPDYWVLQRKVAEADDAESALMRALQGTKAQIDEGATIGQVGIAARAQPISPRQLTASYDDLVEKAAQATDIETKQAILRQASQIEDQIAQLPKSKQALSDIDSVAQAMKRYEQAMADVADHLGDAAHPVTRDMVEAVRKAESDTERRLFDRAAQAMDDHAEQAASKTMSWREFTAGKMGEYMKSEGGHAGAMKRLGEEWRAYKSGADRVGKATDEAIKEGAKQAGGEAFGPTPMPPKERIAFAKERQVEAKAASAKARADEAAARQTYKTEAAKAGAAKQAADTVALPGRPAPAVAAPSGFADLGSALELAGMAGVPGLPKPSDLPVVGPVLGLYLKARALKAGAERLMGRVPATGNARAAALAAQTKDKAARVVDRMLRVSERNAPELRRAVAPAAPLVDAVRDRIFDDGNKAPGREAGLQEHVAARSREVAALAADPTQIAMQVRRELRDVTDPDLIAATVEFRTKQIAYLDKVRPQEPPPSPFRREPWKPDKQAAADFARRYAVAMDPTVALEQVAQRTLTPEAAEAYRAVYPGLYAQTQQRLLEQATKLKTTLPRQQLTRMSILFDLPLDDALAPDALALTQGSHATPAAPAGASQPTPPAPSIAGPTNLTSLYQTASERRATR